MILSFHPCFEADRNIICAGREPDADDLFAIKTADAVILPQGCRKSLYEMARKNCLHVFPNYDARFRHEDKIGQIKLFKETDAPYPDTELFADTKSYYKSYIRLSEPPSIGFPFVFKFNWGGEGECVYLIKNLSEFENIMQKAAAFEKEGHTGFLLQKYIPAQNRSLRVAVISKTYVSYWRIQKDKDVFGTSVSEGSSIDADSDHYLKNKTILVLKDFCRKTGINLAGFDILFSAETEKSEPLFLEINYYFGRRGLGGSEKYYEVLKSEINKWLNSLDFKKKRL